MSKVKLDWRLLEKAAVAVKQAAPPPGDPRRNTSTNYTPPPDWRSRMRKALSDWHKMHMADPNSWGINTVDFRELLDMSPIMSEAELSKLVNPAIQLNVAPPWFRPGWKPPHLRIPRDINGDGQISRSERYAPTAAEIDWKKLMSTPEGRQVLSNRAMQGLGPAVRGRKSMNSAMQQLLLDAGKKYGLTTADFRYLFSPQWLYRSQPGRDTSGLRPDDWGEDARPGGQTGIGRYYQDINQGRLERALNAALVKRGFPPQLRHWQKPTPKHLRMPAAGSWGSFWESAFPSLMAKREKARSDEYDMRRQMLSLDRPAHHPVFPGTPDPLQPTISAGGAQATRTATPPSALVKSPSFRAARYDPDNPAWKPYDE